MGRRLGKSLLVLTVFLFVWMTWSAFIGQRRSTAQPALAEARSLVAKSEGVVERPANAADSVVVPDNEVTAKVAGADDAEPNGKAKARIASSLVAHEKHVASAAPIVPTKKEKRGDPTAPIARDGFGRPALTWDLLAQTRFDDKSRPVFAEKLAVVDGETVTLTGFMAPLNDVGSLRSFMLLEIPLGCFYCLVPDPAGIVLVEMKGDSAEGLRFDLVKVTGKIRLNDDDPEDFLYIVSDAEIAPAE